MSSSKDAISYLSGPSKETPGEGPEGSPAEETGESPAEESAETADAYSGVESLVHKFGKDAVTEALARCSDTGSAVQDSHTSGEAAII